MPFARIDNAIQVCRAHLDAIDNTNSDKPEIESYLVSGLVLLIVSQYEALLRRMFADRAARAGDSEVCDYVKSLLANDFRSPAIAKITTHLGGLGPAARGRFERHVQNTDRQAAWGNLMTARHEVVHRTGIPAFTFRELSEGCYPKTREVIDALGVALGLP